MFSVETQVLTRPPMPQRVGDYDLVAHTVAGLQEEIYWAGGDHVIHVEPWRDSRPYSAIFLDFDGTVVQTEGPGRFFYARRDELMRNLGVAGGNDELDVFQERVWRWEGDTVHSYAAMIMRIRDGIDREGNPLDEQTRTRLFPLTLVPFQQLADRAEEIGVEMLKRYPSRVFELAPLMPGAVEFVQEIPKGVSVGIISGSRVETTIKPILDAYAAVESPDLRDTICGLIVGEEDVPGYTKPDPEFYTRALISMAGKMRDAGKIPSGHIDVADIVFIADRVGDFGLDVSPTRRHSVISVGVGDIEPPDPLSAVVADLPTLFTAVRHPLNMISSPVIKRLAHTLRSQPHLN